MADALGVYLRTVLAWHGKAFDGLRGLLQSMSELERACVERALFGHGAPGEVVVGAAPRFRGAFNV